MSAKSLADLVAVLDNGGEGGVFVVWLVPRARDRREMLHELVAALTMTDALAPLTGHVRLANGVEGIDLNNGSRIRFMLADDRTCRGLSADLVIVAGGLPAPPSARMALLARGGQLWDEGVTLS